jgi:hypothetical protein
MKIKIIILCTLCAMFFAFVMSVNGDTSVETVPKILNYSGHFVIEGKTMPNTPVLVIVKGSHDGVSEVYAAKEAISKNDGYYTFSFIMRERYSPLEQANYTLSIMTTEQYNHSFFVLLGSKLEEFLDVIRQGTGLSLFSLLTNDVDFRTKAENIGFSIADFNALSENEQKIVCKDFYSDATITTDTATELAVSFNTNIVVRHLLSADSRMAFDTIFDVMPGGVEKIEVYPKNAREFILNNLYKKMEFQSGKMFFNMLDVYGVIYLLNNANYSSIGNLIVSNASLLGIEGSNNYNKYINSNQKDVIHDLLVNELYKKPVDSLSAFDTVFTKVVNTAYSSIDDSSKPINNVKTGSSKVTIGNTSITDMPLDTSTPLPKPKAPFSDMAQASWAEESITKLYEQGIVAGDGTGRFLVNQPVSREEMVKMLVLAFSKYNDKDTCDFSDVATDKWYAPYIASAYINGIVKGFDDGRFGVGMKITREDATVMIARAMDLHANYNSSPFTDDILISDYAKDWVYTLRERGILRGYNDNSFNPQGLLTRAECAVMIYAGLSNISTEGGGSK